MNTIEALQYLKDNSNTTLVTHDDDDRGYRIEMSIDEQLRDFDGSLFVNLLKITEDGEKSSVHFEEWIELGHEWEVAKEVKYYVTYKLPEGIEELTSGDRYLNYAFGKYFFGSNYEFSDYKVTFTRDEIEEFGIAHPEVRREDLEFIEVVAE